MARSLPSITVLKSARFVAYNALMVFSLIALIAISAGDKVKVYKRAEDRWVLSVGIISTIMAFFAVMAHLFEDARKKFVGTMVEGVYALVLVGFWVAGIPVIMDTGNGIAAASIGFGLGDVIINCNLYFASWICIGLSTWILVHFLQEKTKKDIVKDTNTKTAYWCALMAVSIVLIASCAQYHKNNNCGQAYFKDTDQCTRNSYGMFLGASGVIIGIVMAILTAKSTLKVMYEMIVASVSLILFTFGVGFMTFGSGPATTIGNQYFSIWLAFICCISLLFESIREYIAECNKEEGATKEATETGTATKLDEEKPEGPTEAIEVDL